MAGVRLSILIATIGRRNDSLMRLLAQLMPQTEGKEVEVLAYWNNGERSIGDIRQSLMEEAKGEYICFIDDDDMIPDWYCDEILKNVGEDYIGFQVELFEKDRQMPPVFHSIRYGVWHQDDKGYYRGITHLNPIKRELALQGEFGKQGIGEDESWARRMMPLVKTENYIDKIMYYYRHDADETMFGGVYKPWGKYTRPDYGHTNFRWHPLSKERGEA